VLAFSYGYRGSLSLLFVACRSASLVARGLKDEQTIEDGELLRAINGNA